MKPTIHDQPMLGGRLTLVAGSEQRAQESVGGWLAEGLAVESVLLPGRGWMHRIAQVAR